MAINALNLAEEYRFEFDIASLELRGKLNKYEQACLDFAENFRQMRLLAFLLSKSPSNALAEALQESKRRFETSYRILKFWVVENRNDPL
jgi:hypothetical protein